MMFEKILLAIFVLGACFSATFKAEIALADHQYYAQMRPYLAGKIFLIEQLQYSRSKKSFDVVSTMANPNGLYDGMAIRTGLGFDTMRFLQTGAFYSHVNESEYTGKNFAMVNHELGVASKMTFASTVCNLGLGGGAFFSWSTLRHSAGASELKGVGYFADAELQYFITSRMHLALVGKQLWSDVSSRSPGASVRSLKSITTRIGLGLGIWM